MVRTGPLFCVCLLVCVSFLVDPVIQPFPISCNLHSIKLHSRHYRIGQHLVMCTSCHVRMPRLP
jgi:hypothetical protein